MHVYLYRHNILDEREGESYFIAGSQLTSRSPLLICNCVKLTTARGSSNTGLVALS